MDQTSEQNIPPQSLITQPTTQQKFHNEIPTSNLAKKIFFTILALALLMGIAGGSYYWGTKKIISIYQTKQVLAPPTVTEFSTPSPTPDKTANWITYNSLDNSYTFKYPNDGN